MMERLARQDHQQPALHEAAPSVEASSLIKKVAGPRFCLSLRHIVIATSHTHVTATIAHA